MSVKDTFVKLRAALESVGIPYFVTGSFVIAESETLSGQPARTPAVR